MVLSRDDLIQEAMVEIVQGIGDIQETLVELNGEASQVSDESAP